MFYKKYYFSFLFLVNRYPSRYGLYLKDKPYTPNSLVPLEYEPEDKLLQELNKGKKEL